MTRIISIFQTLQDKLETLTNEDRAPLAPLLHPADDRHQTASGLDHHSHENDSRDSVGNGRSLNTDTIVLIGSLIVMILIGNKKLFSQWSFLPNFCLLTYETKIDILAHCALKAILCISRSDISPHHFLLSQTPQSTASISQRTQAVW